MVFFNSRISPLASAVIFRERLPRATAVVTSAMLRTWAVRFEAIEFTESVRSFQVPATAGTCAWPPSLPSVPTSRATRVTSAAKPLSWSTIVLIVFFNSRISPLASAVIVRERSPRATAVVTSAMLRTWAVRFEAMALTESVRSFQVPATPGTAPCTPKRPSVPTSRATRVTSEAKLRSCSTMVLIVSFNCSNSPRTSTVIFRERSPLATAMVTSAILRTWAVRFEAIELTLSVRSFQVPATPDTWAWPPSLPSVPTSRATRLTSKAKALSWSTMVLIVFFNSRISPLASAVILRERSPRATAVVTSAMLRTWAVRFEAIELTLSVRSFQVPATPGTCGLAAQLAVGAHFAGHAGHFRGKGIELIDHRVDRVLQLQDFALGVGGDLAGEVAAGHGDRDFGNVADLVRKIGGHRIDVVRQALPGAGDAGHVGLPAELAVAADLAGHAADFRGESVELVHHRIDRVLQREDFALGIGGDLSREIALGHGRGHFGDVADLGRQVGGHRIDVVRQVFPCPRHAGHGGLAAQLAFRADFAGHAADLGGKTVELVHHRVDRVLQFEDFTLHVDGDLPREIAFGHGRSHLGDAANLGRKVGGHRVDRVGQVLPGAGHARHDGLAAQLAFRADFAGHAGDFRGKGAELLHHGVHGFLELKDLAADVDGDFLRQVAVGHGDGHFGDAANLVGEVGGHLVDAVGQFPPHPRNAFHLRLPAQFAGGAYFAGDAGDFRGEDRELLDHAVDELCRAEEFAFQRAAVHFQHDGLAKVALGHRADGAGHVRGRSRQVGDERVEGLDFIHPAAGNTRHRHALLELALFAHHPADACRLVGATFVEGQDFVEHVGNFAMHSGPLDGQSPREIAVSEGDQGVKNLLRKFLLRAAGLTIAVAPVRSFFNGHGRRFGRDGGRDLRNRFNPSSARCHRLDSSADL